MAPKRAKSPARTPAKKAAAVGRPLTAQTEVNYYLPYYAISALCFFMGCLHELATPVVMGSLAKGKAHFPQFDNFGDATWKPGDVAFVLAVQYQVGGFMVFVISWMFFMAARNPAHAMLAYAAIAMCSASVLSALQIEFLYGPDPHLFTTPMLLVWTNITGLAIVAALGDTGPWGRRARE